MKGSKPKGSNASPWGRGGGNQQTRTPPHELQAEARGRTAQGDALRLAYKMRRIRGLWLFLANWQPHTVGTGSSKCQLLLQNDLQGLGIPVLGRSGGRSGDEGATSEMAELQAFASGPKLLKRRTPTANPRGKPDLPADAVEERRETRSRSVALQGGPAQCNATCRCGPIHPASKPSSLHGRACAEFRPRLRAGAPKNDMGLY